MIYFGEFKNIINNVDIYREYPYRKTLILVSTLKTKKDVAKYIDFRRAIYLIKYNSISKMYNDTFMHINRMVLLSNDEIRLHKVYFCIEKMYVAYEFLINFNTKICIQKYTYGITIKNILQIHPNMIVILSMGKSKEELKEYRTFTKEIKDSTN